jgi:hypothetical protein
MTREMFSLEVACQRSTSEVIIEKGNIAISTECSRENGNVSKHRLGGFIEDICG